MIVVENIDKVINQMFNYRTQIKSEVSYIILGVGDETVSRLQGLYPDLTITGQYFPNNMEYWIGISRFGVTLTWIKCPISNLFFERERKLGEQAFKSGVPELNVAVTFLAASIATLQVRAWLTQSPVHPAK